MCLIEDNGKKLSATIQPGFIVYKETVIGRHLSDRYDLEEMFGCDDHPSVVDKIVECTCSKAWIVLPSDVKDSNGYLCLDCGIDFMLDNHILKQVLKKTYKIGVQNPPLVQL